MASIRVFCAIVALSVASFGSGQAGAEPQTDKALAAFLDNTGKTDDNERLYKLFDIIWEWQMLAYPEFATYTGYPGQNHRWTDLSLPAIARRQADTRRFLQALESVDRGALTAAGQLDFDLVRKSLLDDIEGQRFKDEYMPLNQMSGVQQDVPQLFAIMPTARMADYANIIARLHGVPGLIEQTVALLEKGREAGLTPPRITLRDVPGQIANLLPDDVSASPMLEPFQRFPDSISTGEQDRLRREATNAVIKEVYPAYRRLYDYLSKIYIPRARTTIGLSALPDGDAWYAYKARHYTTTALTPRQIHEIGLREVKRIRQEMEAIKRQSGFEGTLNEFFAFLRSDPQFFFQQADELLMAYRDIAKRADPELVKLFGTLPRLPYGVKAVPPYAEKSQTTAYYEHGALQTGRPGYFFANTYDLKSRPKWEMQALTLHEAVPGHHLQTALAQEQPNRHDLLKWQFYTAFVEGWGLYAESLGEEMGFYQDPYAKFGQLTYEMWRAIRLVIDTGMHALGWSRQQAINFFQDNAGKAEHDIVVEVDRYIVWPGQALAYKLGELKIKELRAYARQALGDRFDVRAFHDKVLEAGPLPLDVLATRIRAWVAEQKPGS